MHWGDPITLLQWCLDSNLDKIGLSPRKPTSITYIALLVACDPSMGQKRSSWLGSLIGQKKDLFDREKINLFQKHLITESPKSNYKFSSFLGSFNITVPRPGLYHKTLPRVTNKPSAYAWPAYKTSYHTFSCWMKITRSTNNFGSSLEEILRQLIPLRKVWPHLYNN